MLLREQPRKATTRIDPIDSSPRCVHDMLNGQCSWCRGLPDVPLLDIVNAPEPPARRLVWMLCERRDVVCARCGGEIRLGERGAWSDSDGGVVGECCEYAQ